jgi:hypothetical protein
MTKHTFTTSRHRPRNNDHTRWAHEVEPQLSMFWTLAIGLFIGAAILYGIMQWEMPV